MRYLIFGGPGIGDTIIELALAKGIKKSDSTAVVDLLTSSKMGTSNTISEILKWTNEIDHYYCWSRNDKINMLKVFMKLKANKYQYGFSCNSDFKATNTPVKVCKLLKCKSVCKYVEGKVENADILVNINDKINFVLQEEMLLNSIFPKAELDLLTLDIEGLREQYKINSQGKKIVCLVVGTNITIYWKDGKRFDKNIKEWDLNRWIELSNKVKNAGYFPVLLGGLDEKERLSKIETIPFEFINLCGETTITDSLSVLAQCDLVVGADTGMLHCAAALNKKTISLFGGTDYQVWRPYSDKNKVLVGECGCSPCYGKEHAIYCEKRTCMEQITVEQVFNKIMETI